MSDKISQYENKVSWILIVHGDALYGVVYCHAPNGPIGEWRLGPRLWPDPTDWRRCSVATARDPSAIRGELAAPRFSGQSCDGGIHAPTRSWRQWGAYPLIRTLAQQEWADMILVMICSQKAIEAGILTER